MKKISLFLLLTMLVSLRVCAWDIYSKSRHVYFNLDVSTNTATVTYGDRPDYSGSISIPATIKYQDITYDVTSIGNYAFDYCSGLTSVTIPNSVTSIGSSAFGGCSGLKSVTIPNSVRYIGNSAFEGCSGLTSVTIPNSVTSIGERAFQNCSDLTSVTIPNSVRYIGNYAFDGCSSLTSVHITDLAEWCKISFSDFEENPLYYAHHLYLNDSEIKDLVIPNSVTSIGDYAFENCYNMTSVTIPNSVTSIGSESFYNCFGLTSVTIGNSVTSIEDYAFKSCSGLTSVTCEAESVPSTGSRAFYIVPLSRMSLYVPSASIEAYKKTSPWSDFGTIKANNIYDDICYRFDKTTKQATVISGDEKYNGIVNIPANVTYNGETYSVTSIGAGAFESCSSLTSVTIPNSVTSIGSNAFYGCSGLTEVQLNSNAIASKSYSSSSNLGTIFGSQVKEYIIGNSVTSIGSNAFSGCYNLISVTIGNSVTSIGSSAFSDCSGLTSVCITDLAAWYKISFNNASSNPLYYAHHLFMDGKEITDLTIPNSVTAIGKNAFYGCSGLTSVTIPNSVTSIGINAFYGCSGLTSVTIPNSVTSIENYAFKGCSGLTKVELNSNAIASRWYGSNPNLGTIFGNQVKEYIIGNGVTSIGNYAFDYCSGLTSVTIPNSVTSIGDYAFYGCSGLTSVTIPNSVTSIGSSAFSGCYFAKQDFINNSSLDAETKNYWGANIVDSRENGFVIKDGALIRYTGNEASVIIPNSVTSIGGSVFYNCSGLTSVTIPNSVTSIGGYAFYNCSGLKNVYCYAENVPSTGSNVFTSSNIANATLYVPSASLNTYKKNAPWSGFGTIKAIKYDGIYYKFDKTTKQATVISGDEKYTGIVNIPETVTYNGEAYSVTSIGSNAFYNCSGLTSVIIPNSVTSIEDYAFKSCSGLTSVTCEAESVPSTGSSVFSYVPQSSATLYVPSASVDAYKKTAPWSSFGTIKAIIF